MYSIRMRAAQGGAHEKGGRHISGAERLVEIEALEDTAASLVHRALHHSKGQADFISLTMEEVEPEAVLSIPTLSVTSCEKDSVSEGRAEALRQLQVWGISEKALVRAMDLLEAEGPFMRGAMLVDAVTGERRDQRGAKGVRVSRMDYVPGQIGCTDNEHFREALALASKVAQAPGILGEICWSDDPDYVVGYVAGAGIYHRITPMKEMGSDHGGRVFFVDPHVDIDELISFLEEQVTLVVPHTLRQETVIGTEIEERPSSRQDLEQSYVDFLHTCEEQHRYRRVPAYIPISPTEVLSGRKRLLMMASNNYLGLSFHPRVQRAVQKAVERYGAGSTGSRLISGGLDLAYLLEQDISAHKCTEDAVLFNTGYMANVGAISALVGPGDHILSDALNHASIIDGCRLSGAHIHVYRHVDMNSLEATLRTLPPTGRRWIVTDGVFSMDGNVAPLIDICNLAEKYHALVMVDDAHGTGVLGNGHGTVWEQGVVDRVAVQVGTLSKALGASGGFVATSHTLAEYLRNRARSFIFSTALSPMDLAAGREALRIIQEDSRPTVSLWKNRNYLQNALEKEGIIVQNESAIFPIIVHEEKRALAVSAALREAGIVITAIRPPSVPVGESRLRLTVTAAHTFEQIDRVAKALGRALQE